MTRLLIWRNDYEEGFCVIESPEGIERDYELSVGASRAQGWSSDVICRMNPEYPDDLQLSDNLFGTLYIIVSKRIMEFLLKKQIGNVEFLPVTILNHKGRVASKEYYIMNPLDVIDCIDLDRSGVKWNRIEPDMIESCEKLVLKDDAVQATSKVFRPKFWPTEILIRKELAEDLVSSGRTGLQFINPIEFIGI